MSATQAQELIDAISAVSRKLDLIFGGHALINGRFVQLGKIREGE